MIGFAKLLLMANQWAHRNRASFCWCGTSLKTSVKSPRRLNKWRGNQQIPNITTTMTNILTTWNERKKIGKHANNRSSRASSILQNCLFVNKTLKFRHALNECCNYCPINSVRFSVINLSPGCFMLFISICFSFEYRSYVFKQKYFLICFDAIGLFLCCSSKCWRHNAQSSVRTT